MVTYVSILSSEWNIHDAPVRDRCEANGWRLNEPINQNFAQLRFSLVYSKKKLCQDEMLFLAAYMLVWNGETEYGRAICQLVGAIQYHISIQTGSGFYEHFQSYYFHTLRNQPSYECKREHVSHVLPTFGGIVMGIPIASRAWELKMTHASRR